MRPFVSVLDRYLLASVAVTLGAVFGLVIALMLFEHLPRLFDLVHLSGRKSYIVVSSMASLLPEYCGIGLLFGLYLAIALTVRRLSLRGELDVIEASGVPTRRWMRFPALLALVVAGLLLCLQGWLVPAGERRLADLGRNLADGTFGYDLAPGELISLGKGVTLRFEGVDGTTGALQRIFFRTGQMTFTALRGRFGFDLQGDVLADLESGRSVNGANGQSVAFSHFHFDSGQIPHAAAARGENERRKRIALPALLASGDGVDRAVGWSRVMWPAFALLIPVFAVVLGKPARRSASTLGLMTGLILLVLFIRTAGLVATSHSEHPGWVAGAAMAGWLAIAGALTWGERRGGAGYVDTRLRKLLAPLVRMRARPLKPLVGTTGFEPATPTPPV